MRRRQTAAVGLHYWRGREKRPEYMHPQRSCLRNLRDRSEAMPERRCMSVSGGPSLTYARVDLPLFASTLRPTTATAVSFDTIAVANCPRAPLERFIGLLIIRLVHATRGRAGRPTLCAYAAHATNIHAPARPFVPRHIVLGHCSSSNVESRPGKGEERERPWPPRAAGAPAVGGKRGADCTWRRARVTAWAVRGRRKTALPSVLTPTHPRALADALQAVCRPVSGRGRGQRGPLEGLAALLPPRTERGTKEAAMCSVHLPLPHPTFSFSFATVQRTQLV